MLIAQLTPAFREFSGTLRDTRAFAPQLRRLVTGLGSAQGAALDGIPAAIRFLDGLRRFTGALPSALANLNPILGYIGAYRQDLVALVANLGLAAEGFVAGDTPGTRLHNLRGMAVIGPDGLASYPNQLASARKNPYARPGSVQALRDGLTVFDDRHCTGAPWPKIVPGAGLSPLTLSTLATSILGDGTPIAPPCKLAPPRGGGTRFPQLVQDALPTIP